MANALDIFVVPLYRRNGQDQAYLPGLHVLAASKRAARGRAGERLVLQLSLPPEITLSADQQHALLSDLAAGYFRTPGSVTSALREQFVRINAYFLQLNQRGQPAAAARLTAISVRDERVTLAQAGPQHAFQLNAGIQHFYDAAAAGRGLGMGSQTEIRFFQAELAAGDCLLLAPDIPTGWNEKTLANISGQKLSTLRRRFLSEAGPQLSAVLLMAQPGSGRLSLMSSLEEGTAATPQPPVPAANAPERARLSNAQSWQAVREPAQPAIEDTAAHNPAHAVEPPTQAVDTGAAPDWPPPYTPDPPEPSGFAVLWDEISTRASNFWQRSAPVLRNLLMRLLPDEPVFNLPRQTLAIIAIVVPLAVVVLVSVVYLQFGRGQLYQNYLAQAQSAAALAEARENPTEVRQAWLAAVHFAERASVYEQDAEAAQQLLAEARLALDGLDLIERMNLQPALFTNLPRATNITRMVADSTNLYMLDATTGKVLRGYLASGAYQLDTSFSCEPAQYAGTIVSQLVDIALLPPRTHALGATLTAIDANGNIIYCIIDERPTAGVLIEPDSRWGNPTAIAVENNNLYLLDPVTNAVWIYGGEDGAFVSPPRFFFGAQVPSMQRMQDIIMDGNTLYLLADDGHVVRCTYSEDLDTPTTCEDPLEFIDTRPGQQSGAYIAGANFSQFLMTDPPGPSLFLFDPVVPAVYQFSTHLNISRQLRAQNEIPTTLASAFTISPNRFLFMAFGNEVYFGPMP